MSICIYVWEFNIKVPVGCNTKAPTMLPIYFQFSCHFFFISL